MEKKENVPFFSKFDEKIKNIQNNLYDPKNHHNIDFLLDCFSSVIYELKAKSDAKSKLVNSVLERLKPIYDVIQKSRLGMSDFATLKVLGKGAFGEVCLVRHKETQKVFALKAMNKSEMVKRDEALCLWEEREIMALSNSDWLVKMYYSFQDQINIYMVMEFVQGGDMVNFMENYDINEDVARFYLAEACLGLDFLHSIGFIHRDVKPDNMLLDHKGHLKICDFGTCIRMDKDGKVNSNVAVGTPDYISPEVLQSQNSNIKYGKEVDWWSVGIFLYEFLLGDTPFYSKSLVGTYNKILNYQKNLEFPEDAEISAECVTMIKGFLCAPDKRLGMRGMEEIESHMFYKGCKWKWKNVRETTPPVVPDLDNEADTSAFEGREENDLIVPITPSKNFEHFPFVGFSFSGDYVYNNPKLSDTSASVSSTRASVVSTDIEIKGNKDIENLYNKLLITVDIKENALKQAEAKITEMNKLKMDLDTENKEMKSKMKSMETEIHNHLQEIKKYEVQIKFSNISQAETKKHYDELKLQTSQLNDTLEKLKAIKLKYETQINEITQDRDETKKMLDNLNAEFQTMKNNYKTLRNEIDEIKMTFNCSTVGDLKIFVNKMQVANQDMTKKLVSCENEIKNYEQMIKEKSGAKSEKDNLELGIKYKNLCDEKVSLQAQVTDLNAQKNELVTKNNILTQNLTNMTEENSSLTNKLQELNSKVHISLQNESKLIGEKNDILINNIELKSKLDKFLNLSRDFDHQTTMFEEKFSYFELKMNSVSTKFEEISKIIYERERTISELNEKISRITKENSENVNLLTARDTEITGLKSNIERLEALSSVQSYDIDLTGETKTGGDEGLRMELDSVKKSFEEYKRKSEKTIETERLLKEESIKKLNQILSVPQFTKAANSTIKAKAAANRSDRKVEQQYKQLQMEHMKLRDEHQENIKNYDSKISELNTIIQDLQSTIENLSKEKRHVERRESVRIFVDANSIPESLDPVNEIISQDYLYYPLKMVKSSRKINWSRVIVSLTRNTFIVYKSTEISESNIMHKIQLGLIYYVRPISQNDLIRSKPTDIPKIFQIIYNDDIDAAEAFTNEISNDKCTVISNHCLINIQYHMPATCDVCGKGLWGFIKSSYAMECKNCHFKCHRDHATEPKSIPLCRDYENRRMAKEILLMADNPEKQKSWIELLLNKMKTATNTIDRARSGSSLGRKMSTFGSQPTVNP